MGFREGLGEALGAVACSASRGYRRLSANVPTFGTSIAGPVADLGSYLMERTFCDKEPITSPYSPGRCPEVYLVTVTFRITGDPSSGNNQTYSAVNRRWGPIGQARIVRDTGSSPGQNDTFVVKQSNYGDGFSARGPQQDEQIAGPLSLSKLAAAVILGQSSQRLPAGMPDSCGTYDDNEPYDPKDFTYNVNITYDTPGGVSVIIPFVAIVAPFFINNKLELNMPVSFKLSPSFQFKPNFDFDFTANLNLNTGDVNLNFYRPPGGGNVAPNPDNYKPPGAYEPDPNVPPRHLRCRTRRRTTSRT